MGFGDDEDILQDFLVEAGEILEQLSEQLVDLEQRPDDTDLLNAIFRGFHTVKGGAGFLQLTAMVDCCHVTENLFDILRNGKRTVTSELMDVVLQALDTVNHQFEAISKGEEPPAAEPELIAQLERLVSCEDLAEGGGSAAPEPAVAEVAVAEAGAGPEATEGDITDAEFERLLDAISDDAPAASAGLAAPTPAEPAPANDSDEITEDEFEGLLDQLHGKGKGPGAGAGSGAPAASAPDSPAAAQPESDEIGEDEFEALLDQLHGSGKGPGAKPKTPPAADSGAGAKSPATPAKGGGDDLITEDEFEELLDQLHGSGQAPKGPKIEAEAEADKVTPAAAPKPKPKPSAPKPEPAREPAAAAAPAKPAARTQARDAAAPQANVAAAETTVRVDTQRLDDIMNMVGELVLVRNRLVRLGLNSNDEALGKAVANLDVVTADLQTAVMKTRMQPIKKVFGRFPRVVRDLARNLKKEINLELQGEETDLDKNLVEALADPLVHLVRNAVDHGIELPATREANGKPRVGTVILAAEQEGDHILLSITDDGGGMDADKLRNIAVSKGILDEDAAQRLSDTEAFDLIFAPGFSTKQEISDVSGRGVGMDVVKTKITQLNGSIEIQSKLGEGSRIVIKVPLTLAIMPTLMIMLGKQTFALPLVSVNEIFHMDLTKSNVVSTLR